MAEARTRTTIANYALDILGKGPMANVDAPVGELERRIAAQIDDAIDFALRMGNWPSARETIDLPGETLSNDDYTLKITLPQNCVKVWKVGGRLDGWERRSGGGAGAVVTKLSAPVSVEYSRRISPADMQPELAYMCAAVLAERCKSAAGLSANRRLEVTQTYKRSVIDCVRITAGEDGPDVPFTSEWLAAMDGI